MTAILILLQLQLCNRLPIITLSLVTLIRISDTLTILQGNSRCTSLHRHDASGRCLDCPLTRLSCIGSFFAHANRKVYALLFGRISTMLLWLFHVAGYKIVFYHACMAYGWTRIDENN